jgi:hypothetical protein
VGEIKIEEANRSQMLIELKQNEYQCCYYPFQPLHLVDIQAAPSFSGPNNFTFDVFDQTKDYNYLQLERESSIVYGALQITPDSVSQLDKLTEKAGRVMYSKPFKLWSSNDNQASFISSFDINIYKMPNWMTGEGLAFLIAPDMTMPAASFRQ